jgi:hypothetical protein
MANPDQVLRIIDSKIRPSITYSFGIAPYTIAEVEQLDKSLAQLVRSACQITRGFAQAGIQMSRQHAGLGVRSLMNEYVQISTASLVDALNDDGYLGETTRQLLTEQKRVWRSVPMALVSAGWHQSTTLRQLEIVSRAGITLQGRS